jgi:hypothetical protein
MPPRSARGIQSWCTAHTDGVYSARCSKRSTPDETPTWPSTCPCIVGYVLNCSLTWSCTARLGAQLMVNSSCIVTAGAGGVKAAPSSEAGVQCCAPGVQQGAQLVCTSAALAWGNRSGARWWSHICMLDCRQCALQRCISGLCAHTSRRVICQLRIFRRRFFCLRCEKPSGSASVALG